MLTRLARVSHGKCRCLIVAEDGPTTRTGDIIASQPAPFVAAACVRAGVLSFEFWIKLPWSSCERGNCLDRASSAAVGGNGAWRDDLHLACMLRFTQ